MAGQLMILPTGEAMRANKDMFASISATGLPLMILTQYLIQLLMSGEPDQQTQDELVDGWINYLIDSRLASQPVLNLMNEPAIRAAIYALYQSMHQLQETLLSLPLDSEGKFISALVHHGWMGQDMIVAREISDLNRLSRINRNGA